MRGLHIVSVNCHVADGAHIAQVYGDGGLGQPVLLQRLLECLYEVCRHTRERDLALGKLLQPFVRAIVQYRRTHLVVFHQYLHLLVKKRVETLTERTCQLGCQRIKGERPIINHSFRQGEDLVKIRLLLLTVLVECTLACSEQLFKILIRQSQSASEVTPL